MENNENVNNTENTQNEPKAVKKSNIVPNYMKKNEVKVEDKKKTGIGKGKFKVKSKISLVIMCVAAVVILALIVFGVYNIIKYSSTRKYSEYEEKMKIYGFDKMYDNGSAKSSEKVTRSEAIKVITSSVLNSYIAPTSVEAEKYTNSNWVEYAINLGIFKEDKSIESYTDYCTYMEVMQYIEYVKQKYLGKEVVTSATPTFGDFVEYNNEEQIIIKDLVYNKILNDSTDDLNAKSDIIKGQLNELIVNFVEKYNLITMDSEKLAINEEKMPSNKNDYPYVVANVDKEVYETSFYNEKNDNFVKPIDLYADMKESYSTIKIRVERYFNTILNVDYNTIDENKLENNLRKSIGTKFSSEELKEYIEYVKNNKIKITGSAKIQWPIVYHDGENVRVRVKVTYKVESADNLDNVLFGDLISKSNDKYSLDKVEKYIDVPFYMIEDQIGYIVPNAISKMGSGKI